MTLLQRIQDLNMILVMIYCFVDDFLKGTLVNIKYAIERPGKNHPPLKKHNLSLAELASLALFRFFTGHRNWKDFYRHLKTYHKRDFPNLPRFREYLWIKLRFFGRFSSGLGRFFGCKLEISRRFFAKNSLRFFSVKGALAFFIFKRV